MHLTACTLRPRSSPRRDDLASSSRAPDEDAALRQRVRHLELMLDKLKNQERELFVMGDPQLSRVRDACGLEP